MKIQEFDKLLKRIKKESSTYVEVGYGGEELGVVTAITLDKVDKILRSFKNDT